MEASEKGSSLRRLLWLEGGEGEEGSLGKLEAVEQVWQSAWPGTALALTVMRKGLDLILRAVESCESVLRRKVKLFWGAKSLLFKQLKHFWI